MNLYQRERIKIRKKYKEGGIALEHIEGMVQAHIKTLKKYHKKGTNPPVTTEKIIQIYKTALEK
jgi:hypothetical protein